MQALSRRVQSLCSASGAVGHTRGGGSTGFGQWLRYHPRWNLRPRRDVGEDKQEAHPAFVDWEMELGGEL